MDTNEAIAHLESLGYSVHLNSPKKPIFVCSSGHAHRSEEARKSCDRPAPAKPKKTRPAEDYLKAYELRQSGESWKSIGENFGVGATRAIQMVKRVDRAIFLIDHPPSYPLSDTGLAAELRGLIMARRKSQK